jgi:kynureninase
MDTSAAISQLRQGQKPEWPANANTVDFAKSLDNSSDFPKTLRHEYVVPTKAQLKRKTLTDDAQTSAKASSSDDEGIYFCGNSLGLQSKAVGEYLNAYLKTWGSIAVGGHFTPMTDSPITPFQDMAGECSRRMSDIVGASPSEIVAMNTLTINLHLMMAAFYKPTEKKHKIMCEWRPFPSDWYAIESQIEWHGLDPKKSMLLVKPDDGYLMTTENILNPILQRPTPRYSNHHRTCTQARHHNWLGSRPRSRQRRTKAPRLGRRLRLLVYLQIHECWRRRHRRSIRAL